MSSDQATDGPTWSLVNEALDAADTVYLTSLEPIDISPFTEGLVTDGIGTTPLLSNREDREIYSDTLYDLHRLLEEVRFEIATAVMLLVDFRVRRDRGEIAEPEQNDFPVRLSIELIVTLAPFTTLPSPSTLAGDLHRQMSGERNLSRWFAGQLLDSAALRSLSCMDRVTTALHLRAGLAIHKRRDGSLRLPSFNRSELQVLERHYEHEPAWPAFKEIADNPIYKIIKRFRDGTVHHRRWPSELHGEREVAYWDAGAPFDDPPAPERLHSGLTAQDHVGLLVATWAKVLWPAVERGGRLLV